VRILIGDGMARISSRQQNHNNMPEETLRESGRGAFGIKSVLKLCRLNKKLFSKLGGSYGSCGGAIEALVFYFMGGMKQNISKKKFRNYAIAYNAFCLFIEERFQFRKLSEEEINCLMLDEATDRIFCGVEYSLSYLDPELLKVDFDDLEACKDPYLFYFDCMKHFRGIARPVDYIKARNGFEYLFDLLRHDQKFYKENMLLQSVRVRLSLIHGNGLGVVANTDLARQYFEPSE
jgi:hypothetical protein